MVIQKTTQKCSIVFNLKIAQRISTSKLEGAIEDAPPRLSSASLSSLVTPRRTRRESQFEMTLKTVEDDSANSNESSRTSIKSRSGNVLGIRRSTRRNSFHVQKKSSY